MPADVVCQLVVMPYNRCRFWTVGELLESDRGTDGYGSTVVL